MALVKCAVCANGYFGSDGYCAHCRAFIDDFRPMSYSQAATMIELLRGLKAAVESVIDKESGTSGDPRAAVKVSTIGDVSVVGEVTAYPPR